jgi:hypothetical protein
VRSNQEANREEASIERRRQEELEARRQQELERQRRIHSQEKQKQRLLLATRAPDIFHFQSNSVRAGMSMGADGS